MLVLAVGRLAAVTTLVVESNVPLAVVADTSGMVPCFVTSAILCCELLVAALAVTGWLIRSWDEINPEPGTVIMALTVPGVGRLAAAFFSF